nr:MAG TPA: Protein of unknown function (DUF3299) [Caudoviricetes sp.]
MQRRQFVKCLLGTPLLVAVPAFAAVPELRFEEMYAGNSVLGLQFSEKLKSLSGKRIRIRGFMNSTEVFRVMAEALALGK